MSSSDCLDLDVTYPDIGPTFRHAPFWFIQRRKGADCAEDSVNSRLDAYTLDPSNESYETDDDLRGSAGDVLYGAQRQVAQRVGEITAETSDEGWTDIVRNIVDAELGKSALRDTFPNIHVGAIYPVPLSEKQLSEEWQERQALAKVRMIVDPSINITLCLPHPDSLMLSIHVSDPNEHNTNVLTKLQFSAGTPGPLPSRPPTNNSDVSGKLSEIFGDTAEKLLEEYSIEALIPIMRKATTVETAAESRTLFNAVASRVRSILNTAFDDKMPSSELSVGVIRKIKHPERGESEPPMTDEERASVESWIQSADGTVAG